MHNYYTNEDLLVGVQSIARQVVLDNYKPDIILGVLRGGVIPAVYLSHWFKAPMASVEWSTRDGAVGCDLRDVISKVAQKKVLLVDDICDTGLTMQQLSTSLMMNGANNPIELKSACLHHNLGQNVFEPDYYHLEINKLEDPRWVVYPWENL